MFEVPALVVGVVQRVGDDGGALDERPAALDVQHFVVVVLVLDRVLHDHPVLVLVARFVRAQLDYVIV